MNGTVLPPFWNVTSDVSEGSTLYRAFGYAGSEPAAVTNASIAAGVARKSMNDVASVLFFAFAFTAQAAPAAPAIRVCDATLVAGTGYSRNAVPFAWSRSAPSAHVPWITPIALPCATRLSDCSYPVPSG